jgi:metal-sulfur cluster biosynthetic enzyme/Fe-S cluster assembly iron-binding protein IscA
MIDLLKESSVFKNPVVQFTPRAVAELQQIRAQQLIPAEYLVRLGANMRAKQRYDYLLGYSQRGEDDLLLKINSVDCVIEAKLAAYFDNVEIDFVDSITGRGFLFSPKDRIENSPPENPLFLKASDVEKSAYYALKEVIDPELGVNLVDLGLVYKIDCNNDVLKVTYSLSTKNCPMSGIIRDDITSALKAVVRNGKFELELTHEPIWSPAMITPKGKILLQK